MKNLTKYSAVLMSPNLYELAESTNGWLYKVSEIDPLLKELEELREYKRLREFWDEEKEKNTKLGDR